MLAGGLALTAVLFIAAIGTVLKAIAPETADDAVDPTGAGEECSAALGFGFCWQKIQT